MNVAIRTLELLKSMQAGDPAARDKLFEVNAKIAGSTVYRDPDLSPQKVRSLEFILSEWPGMFCFSPGRIEGLPIITNFVQKLISAPPADVTNQNEWVYDQPEWKSVIELRGPVETVLLRKCSSCNAEFPRMGTSGFLSIRDFWCESCGTVHFVSAYDDIESVECSCGQLAVQGCGCEIEAHQDVKGLSPYEFFASHAYVRHPGS